MNKKITTTEDILNDRTMFSEKQAEKIRANIEKKAKKIWGGARENAGRKAKPRGEVLPFVRRLSERENQLIDDIRNKIINIDDIQKLKQQG